MSEVDVRPAPTRGRSSTRGGRGGYGRGGPRGGHRPTNGTATEVAEPPVEDQGQLGELKKQYSSQLAMLKEMFPDWSDVDLVFALQETDGDIQTTIDRITEGHVSQFSEIKKPKDRARSKAKETPAAGSGDFSSTARGGRSRGGLESSRGGRGRGDRGRGGSRGGRGGAAAGIGAPRDTGAISIPTAESTAYDAPAATEAATNAGDPAPAAKAESAYQGGWGDVVTSEATPAAASEGTKSAVLPDGAAKKTWASMFAQPKPAPAPAVPKQANVPGPVPAELQKSSEPTAVPEELSEPEAMAPAVEAEQQSAPEPPSQPDVPQIEEPKPTEEPVVAPDPLTEDNLENLPDSSHPPATHTAASTVGSVDPRVMTPMVPGQQAPIGRPPLGGFASSAYRATGMAGRSASYQRRVLDQQEAVVMPGHNAVDRATVQFGSMGLNGDSEDQDVDGEREEPETRTQPPQQSPPGQPRASLPPAPVQPPLSQESSMPESLPTPKQAPGLPPLTQQQQQQHQAYAQQQPQESHSALPSHQGLPQDPLSSGQSYGQYGRYGQSEASAPAQKSYDPFSHQTPSAFDQYSSQSQPSAQQPQQPQQSFGGFSSAPSDYSHYYTADQQRNAYQNYYGSSYGQQSAPSQQDAGAAQQRTSSSLGADANQPGFPSSQGSQQQAQSRYNDPQSSSHETPNALMGGQQQASGPSQQLQQQQAQYNSAYPYGHPYYQSPYQAAYQNQFGQPTTFSQAPYGNKGGMYGQPYGYGMNAPSSYDHASSPAASGFSQQQSSMQSRDAGLGSSLGDYGRSASSQPSGFSSGGFGSSDSFGRSQSGYQSQGQGYGQQQSAPADDLKPFGESKATGPSPVMGQPGRPESAANSVGAQGQPGLPPPQGQQQSFGGYPGFSQGSQYGGGLGGLGGHQGQGQQGGYGAYGGGFGNSYSQYGRGGWSGSYGH